MKKSNKNNVGMKSLTDVKKESFQWLEEYRKNNEEVSSVIVTCDSDVEFNRILENELSDRFLRFISENTQLVESLISQQDGWKNMVRSQVKTEMLRYYRIKGSRGGNLVQAPVSFQTKFDNVVKMLDSLSDFIGKDLRMYVNHPEDKKDSDGKVLKVENENYNKFVWFTFSKPMVKSEYSEIEEIELSTIANANDEKKTEELMKTNPDYVEYCKSLQDDISDEYLKELQEKYPEILVAETETETEIVD